MDMERIEEGKILSVGELEKKLDDYYFIWKEIQRQEEGGGSEVELWRRRGELDRKIRKSFGVLLGRLSGLLKKKWREAYKFFQEYLEVGGRIEELIVQDAWGSMFVRFSTEEEAEKAEVIFRGSYKVMRVYRGIHIFFSFILDEELPGRKGLILESYKLLRNLLFYLV